MRVLLLVAAAILLGTSGPAQPDPHALFAQLRTLYQELPAFYAEVRMSWTLYDESAIVTPLKVWYRAPFARIERELPDELRPFLAPLEVWDCERRVRWYRVKPGRWVQEEFLELEGPWSWAALGLAFLARLQPKSVEEEVREGKPFWALRASIPPASELTLWIDPETLYIWEVRYGTGSLRQEHILVKFVPGAEMAEDLFQPPRPEEIARTFKLSSEGLALVEKVVKRYGEAKSFFLRKEERGTLGASEKRVYWQPPYLRVEVRTLPSPRRGSQLALVELLDLHEGVVYFYDPEADRWEREEIFVGMPMRPEGDWLSALVCAIAFAGLNVSSIVEIVAETLEGRPVWRLTGQLFQTLEAPLAQWWIDQESLRVVQYTRPELVPKGQDFQDWEWKVVTVRIREYQENVELDPKLFAVPKEVPARRPPTLPLDKGPELPKEKLAPTAPPLTWEPFSPGKLEEALRTSPVVVLYFGADWCSPCLAMEEEAFRAPAIVELLAPLPRFKVDLSDPWDTQSRRIAELYKARGLPTLLFLGPEGKVLGRLIGYGGVTALYREIQRILKEVSP
ncbi:MAG: thioredoxin family protein [Candidatus Bipolaricaulaceae bacterium]